MALSDYLATEIGLDWKDGLITRREALRRLGLMGLTATSATALLAACSDGAVDTEAGQSTSTTGTPATTATTGASSTASSATTASSTASSASTATSAAAGAAATAEAITFTGPAGQLQGYYAAATAPKGAVLIIHENRGITAHFQELPGRFAGVGYSALALDLLSRSGGSASIPDEGARSAAFASIPAEDLVGDMRAAIDELTKRVPNKKIGAIGFCFGGGQVWSLLAAGEPRVAAAAPFYGPGPADADFSKSKAAVLGVYAENDSRVNASKDAMKAALDKAGLVNDLRVFPGADHAFFNDTGARYNATQAAAAWTAVQQWFGEYLA